MTPYIEYNDKRYEFEASFTLEQEFNKALQERYKEMLLKGNITEQDINEINEIEKFVKENTNLTEQELMQEHKEMYEKIKKYAPKMQSLILTDLYEEYCFKMLNIKYGIDLKTWDDMKRQYYEEYCDSFQELDELFDKIIEKVFMKKQELKKKKKKTLAWIEN